MTVILADRVRETTSVVGTGAAILLGAVTGYQAFSVIGNGSLTYYTIADQAGSNWEVGIGTYSSSTLTRTTILASSNAGSVVNFTTGTKDVFLTQPSEKAVTTQSMYTPDTFAGTFVDGVAVDYVTGNGRISVGTADTLTFYTGGVGSTAMASMTSTGINSTAIGATTASTGAFTTLGATGVITANTTTNNQTYTTTGAGTITLTSGTVGSINNFNIGASTAGTGAFTTLSASSTVSGVGFSNYLASPPAIGGTTAAAGTFTTLNATSIGATTPGTGAFTTLNATSIGATTAGTGAFTTLSASSTVSGVGFSNYLASPPAIGGTAPSTGKFTTLTATADSSFTSTGALLISKGTTGQQPGTPVTGMIRYNTTSNQFEGYAGASPSWLPVGGSVISNDTSTATPLYPVFANATSGTATTVYTSNANYLYTPSTGELQAPEHIASNGIFVNASTVNANYTISATNNGGSFGPITVATGVTVTVSSGATWTVV